jgi:hypothetical protein
MLRFLHLIISVDRHNIILLCPNYHLIPIHKYLRALERTGIEVARVMREDLDWDTPK